MPVSSSTSDCIQTLSLDVVNLIAAGEVIDSLAAVVRELVENSLDAGATRIIVSLWPDLWRVQVADNGRGMSLTDLRLCAEAHCTSKIRTSDDLSRITSLGFRGEALHSIVQLADLEVLSRSAVETEAAGGRIFYQNGKLAVEETTAIAPGTIVTVSNLFSKWQLRRQGLPAMSQQMRSVQDVVGKIALCHPGVTWQVWQNERQWFKVCPGNSARQILPQLLASIRGSDLQGLKVGVAMLAEEKPRMNADGRGVQSQLEVVLGLPDRCHRQRADWVRVAVNGRVVRSPQLEQSIIAAFARTLPKNRYPVCFLNLNICPSQIDWNRHPAKSEIYLHSLAFWQEQVAQVIEKALRMSPVTLPATLHNQRVKNLLKVSEEKGAYRLNRDLKAERPSQPQTGEVELMELRAVAQVRQTYIVVEHPAGLWLIEQHIAHERVLYEQLQDCWRLVSVETPIVLANLTSAQLEQLQRLSIEAEPFGEQLWAVRCAPEMLHQREDCAEALMELSQGGDLQEAQAATACRSAIRNGTILDLPEMQSLIDQWKNTRNPRTCPHGRPIYLSLEESALSRFFKRHWVIGKSHGI